MVMEVWYGETLYYVKLVITSLPGTLTSHVTIAT